MYLDEKFVNERLIHALLFTPYNLVFQDFSNVGKFKGLFSIVEGFHFEQIDLQGYEDLETLERVIDNLVDDHTKIIVAFSHPRTEFLHDILQASSYRFVLLVNSNKEVIQRLSEYTGNNLLTYSIKTQQFTPPYEFPELDWPTNILQMLKDYDVKTAQDQVRALFQFAEKLHKKHISGQRQEVKEIIMGMDEEVRKKSLEPLENLFKAYYDREITITEDGQILDKGELPHATIPEPVSHFVPVTMPLSEMDKVMAEERMQDVKQDLKEREKLAREEFVSVMTRVKGEFQKCMNHAMHEYEEKEPTIFKNPTMPVQMYVELRCKSWYDGIPEEVLQDMLTYHVKNKMKEEKILPSDPNFGNFIEMEQDRFLEAIAKLPHESMNMESFASYFTGTPSTPDEPTVEELIKEFEEEMKPELDDQQYFQQCIETNFIPDIQRYEEILLKLLRDKGKG